MSIESDLFEQGKTFKEIAEILEISVITVQRRLKKQGYHCKRGPRKPWKETNEEHIGPNGRCYVRVMKPNGKHHNTLKSVVLMEQKIGCSIPKGYHVHHKDLDKTNDDINNLALITNSEHSSLHNLGERNKNSKLTNEQRREIIRLYDEQNLTITKIGPMFNISPQQVYRITLKKGRY